LVQFLFQRAEETEPPSDNDERENPLLLPPCDGPGNGNGPQSNNESPTVSSCESADGASSQQELAQIEASYLRGNNP